MVKTFRSLATVVFPVASVGFTPELTSLYGSKTPGTSGSSHILATLIALGTSSAPGTSVTPGTVVTSDRVCAVFHLMN